MKQNEKFESFLKQWSGKSRKDLLKRLYALTRYAQRIDNFFSSPFCADTAELESFDNFLELYTTERS